MRHSELKRHTPTFFNRVTRTLYIDTGKDGAPRTIPLDYDGVSAFDDLERLEAIGTFSNSTVRRAFRLACQKLGITGVRPYDLRHSYGTLMYRVTGDLRIVAEMLGHRQQRTTQRYTLGFVPDYMRIAVARFAQASQPGGWEPDPLPPAVERQLRVITGGR
jgi:integrase